MKKFYLGFSTLICLFVLFTLASCTIDSPLVSGDTLGNEDAKNEIQYYSPRKGEAFPVTESLSTYVSATETGEDVDPDWKKLITHFTGSAGVNK
ncbi:hypothetical protein SAMN05443667_10312 [Flavobacterium gillisiae]|uniref:Uncharacterized protein n=1 Tax=Flavobacterium gillisiae TaxID=150146 RepID=A0A1H3ZQP0_9FLAO|nr:hypothetical protein [Flavobacterium gillisiae]SEA25671.1 hypothetical protein SAMN05443667_10312 [Flavobacterium gillisiae]